MSRFEVSTSIWLENCSGWVEFGLVVGVTIGHVVIAKNHDWLMKYFGFRQLVPRRKVRVKGVRRHELGGQMSFKDKHV